MLGELRGPWQAVDVTNWRECALLEGYMVWDNFDWLLAPLQVS
jgi:hypothetical protein